VRSRFGLLLALFGHDGVVAPCPLSGAKQTSVGAGSKTDLAWMTAVGAKRPSDVSQALTVEKSGLFALLFACRLSNANHLIGKLREAACPEHYCSRVLTVPHLATCPVETAVHQKNKFEK
jgi:hypothetical protein